MKLQVRAFVFLGLLTLVACSNNEYEKAMSNGMKSIGEKDYYMASTYFELALFEKKGDEQASLYLNQAYYMERALQAYEKKDFDAALQSLQKVVSSKSGLQTVQMEAEKLIDHIHSENDVTSLFEEKMTEVKNMIDNETYNDAKNKLETLQRELEANDSLSDYESELRVLTEQVKIGIQKKQAKVVDETKEVAAPKKGPSIKSDSNSRNITYQTYTNSRFGFSIQYPSHLMMAPPPTNGDGAIFFNEELEITVYGSHQTCVNGDTIEECYEEELTSIPVNVTYKKQSNNWYVLSYIENGFIVYKKSFFGQSVSNSFIIKYPANLKEKFDPVVTHISKTFVSSAY
ncbi:hypothetical protein [Metabacillus iocasae]|uniref:Uncharacterized protein n=1 Tax=Priestia iocasae TaxID=2291674 RepID=A0ABS2QWN4_9BACI|nr:hypothetical protein [Metabacillus iocasae]MBM7703889.1 hypothetical protein [Metabacillus iocasae]